VLTGASARLEPIVGKVVRDLVVESSLASAPLRFDLTREEYLAMDDREFRARFRERVHHTLEIQTYAAIHAGTRLPSNQTEIVDKLTAIWKEKGLSTDLPDFRWGATVRTLAASNQAGESVDLSRYAVAPVDTKELAAFDRIVRERRSVRHWKEDIEVVDEDIEAIVSAGSWAAHSCNLQSLRFAVVREKNAPGLFRGSDVPGGPVHIVALQDERVYRANPLNPQRNRLIDVGAAVQNMVLEAHARGLGGVWLTFNDTMLERLYERFDLPEGVKIVTYIDVGHPDQTPSPPFRLGIEETLLLRI
jgi:nitroreductase